MNKKIAVILVNFNTFSDTKECVESLRKCTDTTNMEIIVVDNASTKRNREIENYLNQFTTYIQLEKNEGFSAGNNCGIQWAMERNFDYVLLLNNDTVVEKDFLENLLTEAEKKENLGAAIGKIYYFGEKETLWYAGGSVNYNIGKVIQRGFQEKDHGQYDREETVHFVTGCMMLIPISVIKKIGLLEERFFLYAEDLEYSLRLDKYGYKMYYIPNSIIYHKVGASSGRENISLNTQYYMVRNTLQSFFMYQNILQRGMSFVYQTLRYIKYVLEGRYSKKAVTKAYCDFLRNRSGKLEKSL